MKRGLVIALVLLCATNAYAFSFGSSKYEKELELEASGVKLVREVERGGYGVITTQELSDLLAKEKDVLVVDTMPYEASYVKGHIPGAVQFLFPIPEMKSWDNSLTAGKSMEEYQRILGNDLERTIVVYCGFVKCTRSHNGALWAKKMGYKNVLRYPGGIYAWRGADYPVEEGK